MSIPFVPSNMKMSTQWAVRNFLDWVNSHNASSSDICPEDLDTCIDPKELSKWLSLHVTSTRKNDGTKYSPKTLTCLLGGIWRHVHSRNPQSHSLNFMDTKSNDFEEFRSLLDRLFRQLRIEGIGTNPRSAMIISKEEEAMLWEKGVLGNHCLEALLQSGFFYNRKNFHLRGGQEQGFLCVSQLQRLTSPDRYVYVETVLRIIQED